MKTILHKLTFTLCLIVLSLSAWAQSNQYLHFDGADDFVSVPDASQYVANAEGVTMAGWFYTDDLIYGQGMFGMRGEGDGDGEMYVIQLSDGVLECRYISSDGFHQVVGGAGSITAGEWIHLAWVFNGSSIDLFVNGESYGNVPASGVLESMNRPFAIGKCIQSGFNFVFGGRIDEVSLWSRGLTDEEINTMMEDELLGDEPGLELYYKMNQGVPGGDNTAISELISEVGGGTRNGQFVNMALTGEISNFNGELEDGFQSIAVLPVATKLIDDIPFDVTATVNSGLPVSLEVISGPATIAGNTVTLTGTAGTVLLRASQEGNDIFDPAADVDISFEVIDPAVELPLIDIRNPVEGDFYATTLAPILLSSIVTVDFPDLLEITDILYSIDGESVIHTDYGNMHQSAWWTPDDFGTHTLSITASHNEGFSHTETVSFNIVNTVSPQVVAATVDVWADSDNYSVEVEAVLPSYQGVYDHIEGLLDITCPPGGCDPWDRVSSIEVKGHNGEWYEIIRYLTPYGVACNHQIDLTDFMSLLQGKVRFRVNLGTQGNGFLYSLDLDYQVGTPDHPYSTVSKLWYQTYSFGDPANLQPTENFIVEFPANAMTSGIKLVSSGHGWGDNNSGNAAEFHHDIHHIWVDGSEEFEQDNWVDCQPNPDGCSPQNGTWTFDRAGWCPGSIAQFFDYNMSPFIQNNTASLDYIFNESYQDYCHPNAPGCITGVTCPDCDAGFNPHLIVSSYLITRGDAPLDEPMIAIGVDEQETEVAFGVYPNPSVGRFTVDLGVEHAPGFLQLLSMSGKLIYQTSFVQNQVRVEVNASGLNAGVYLVRVDTAQGSGIKRIVVE